MGREANLLLAGVGGMAVGCVVGACLQQWLSSRLVPVPPPPPPPSPSPSPSPPPPPPPSLSPRLESSSAATRDAHPLPAAPSASASLEGSPGAAVDGGQPAAVAKRTRAEKRNAKRAEQMADGGWSTSEDNYVPRLKYRDAQKAAPDKRVIVCQDALEWMDTIGSLPGSVLTGMPDIHEFLGWSDADYSEWVIAAVVKVMETLKEGQIACFHQTDARANRCDTLSKPFLIMKGVERSGVAASLLWHKVALASPCGHAKVGRPGFTHMMCFFKGTPPNPKVKYQNFPDVIDRGQLLWPRGMGIIAVMKSIEFIKWAVGDDVVIVDPFCGHGSVPAVANSMGLKSYGVDLSPGCCRKAEKADTDGLVADRGAILASKYEETAMYNDAEQDGAD